MIMCQKAPSAKRCIKTRGEDVSLLVIEHGVRKHRAPKGALRPSWPPMVTVASVDSESTERQKVN